MRHPAFRLTLLASTVAFALAAQAAPSAADRIAGTELIARDALFGNPERANVQISPDGKYLSWVAAVDGVLNVWVAPADNPSQARAVTQDKARGIRSYFWSYQPDTLLYLRDSGGDEDFHLYAVDLKTGQAKDLTPFPKTTAQVAGVSPKHPGTILVGMNDRDAQWHDIYKVDLASGDRTLLEKNDAQIAGYIADADYTLKYAQRSRPDGGADVLRRGANGAWEKFDDIPFEDVLTTSPGGLTLDGKTLYFTDSRGRNTAALFAIDVASGKRSLVLEDARADVGGTLADPATGKVQAVSVDDLRDEWKVVDPAIRADLEKLEAIGPGDVSVNTRTLDDKTWIVAYSAAEAPLVYYRYDRGAGTLTKLFSARPKLEGKPLVPQWPVEIASRDNKTLVSYLTLPRSADANNDGKADAPVPLVLLVHGGPWARDSYGYGGYATLVGMTVTPDVFKCGVDIVGPSNLVTLFKTFPSYWASFMEQWYRRVGDPRTEAGMEALVQASPITHVDRISKPLLIGQGANDPRVVQAESDQIVEAMTAKNIPVTYVLFPDEGHGFARPENSKAFNAVAEGFLSTCLGGRAEAIGQDFAGSSITVPTGAADVAGLAEALQTHTQDVRK